jgi:SWI/SNF-related matrix-associated actin-dependent regulator of chromatin subfamily A3
MLEQEASVRAVPHEVHFGDHETQLVGLRHYCGTITSGDRVVLVREPLNPYDANAIKVNNSRAVQVGHIKRETAAAFAPLMDKKLVRVEGIVVGAVTPYSAPIELRVYGSAANRDEVIEALYRQNIRVRLQCRSTVLRPLTLCARFSCASRRPS